MDFKPSLNIQASTFVPSVAPVIEFSPIKESNPDLQDQRKNLAPPKMGGLTFDLNKFDVNAPVFKPTNYKPLEGPCIIEQIAA